MANELDVGSIVLQIRANAAGVQEGMRQLEAAMGVAEAKTAQASSGIDASAKKMSASVDASSMSQAAAYAAIAAAAGKAFQMVVNAIDVAIQASERYKAAVIGLQSVAQGRGIGADRILADVDELTDAFFDAAAASTALKNLLSRGYSAEQAINTIKRLKDSAAFGRQASLGLAEAVVTATEGIRNENSILVDNAGVTKNVAKMWEDYAKSIGVATSSLTQAQKIQAEYLGIMEETQHQVGDLAKAADTLSGAQAEAAQSGLLLAQAYGESMTPAVTILTRAKKDLLDAMTGIVREAPGLVSGMTATGVAIAGLSLAAKAAQALKALIPSLQAAAGGVTIFGVALKTAFPWLAAASVAVGLLTAIVTGNARAQEAAAKAAEEDARKRREHVQALTESVDALQDLRTRYEELAKKKNLTYAESEELLGIEKQLNEQHGISVGSLSALGGAYDDTVAKINEKIKAQERELQVERDIAAEQATVAMRTARQEAMTAREKIEQIKEAEGLMRALETVQRSGQEAAQKYGVGSKEATELRELQMSIVNARDAIREAIGLPADAVASDWENALRAAEVAIEAEGPAVVAAAKAAMEQTAGAMRLDGATFNDNTKKAITDVFTALAEAEPPKSLDRFIDQYAAALGNTDLAPAMQTMQDINARILTGATPTVADQQAMQDSWSTMLGFVDNLLDGGIINADQYGATLARLSPLMAPVIANLEAFGDAPAKAMAMWKSSNVAGLISQDVEEANAAFASMQESTQKTQDRILELSNSVKQQNEVIGALETIKQSMSDLGSVTEEKLQAATDTLERYGVATPESIGLAVASIVRHRAILEPFAGEISALFAQLGNDIGIYRKALIDLESAGQGESQQAKNLRSLIALIQEVGNRSVQLQQQGFDFPVELSGGDAIMKQLNDITKKMDEAAESVESIRFRREQIASAKAVVSEALRLEKAGRSIGDEWRRSVIDVLGPEFAGSLQDAASSLETLDVDMQSNIDNIHAQMNAWEKEISAIINGIETGTIDIVVDGQTDTSGLMAAARAALAAINFVRGLFGKSSLTLPSGSGGKSRGGGGGGGGSKTDPAAEAQRAAEDAKRAAEDAARDAENARQEAIRQDLRVLEHKKALNQLTVGEEIRTLERIRAAHRLNADERMDIEERLHDARQRQKDEMYQWDIALLDHRKAMGQLTVAEEIAHLERIKNAHQLDIQERMQLDERLYSLRNQLREESLAKEKSTIQDAYSLLVDALKKRLNAERDAQLKSVDERMKALDDLTNAENEARRQQDYEDNLADKMREMGITKSARRRRELQAEIDKLEEDESLRRLQAARMDEKSLLQDQKQAIQDKYAQLTSEENVLQEALRLVMSNNLDQMTELIASYGDQWKDAGVKLAEHLTAGISGPNSPIIQTFDRLNAYLQDSINQQFANISSGIPLVRSGGVSVTVNGLTVREESDVDAVAEAIYQKMVAAQR